MAKDRIDMLQELGFEINNQPQLRDLRITGQALKGFEVKFSIAGLTNVDDLGQLSPETMTIALFEWLYRLHGEDYDVFAHSCRKAVMIVKDTDKQTGEAA